jgi:hypothetical protein
VLVVSDFIGRIFGVTRALQAGDQFWFRCGITHSNLTRQGVNRGVGAHGFAAQFVLDHHCVLHIEERESTKTDKEQQTRYPEENGMSPDKEGRTGGRTRAFIVDRWLKAVFDS